MHAGSCRAFSGRCCPVKKAEGLLVDKGSCIQTGEAPSQCCETGLLVTDWAMGKAGFQRMIKTHLLHSMISLLKASEYI